MEIHNSMIFTHSLPFSHSTCIDYKIYENFNVFNVMDSYALCFLSLCVCVYGIASERYRKSGAIRYASVCVGAILYVYSFVNKTEYKSKLKVLNWLALRKKFKSRNLFIKKLSVFTQLDHILRHRRQQNVRLSNSSSKKLIAKKY